MLHCTDGTWHILRPNLSNFPHELSSSLMMTTRSCRASRDSGRPKDATCVTGLSQSAGIPSVPLSVPQALRLGRYKWRRAYGAIPTSISSRGTNHGATRPPRGVLGWQSPATPIARLHDAPYRALNEARAGRLVCNKAAREPSKKRAKAACRQSRQVADDLSQPRH